MVLTVEAQRWRLTRETLRCRARFIWSRSCARDGSCARARNDLRSRHLPGSALSPPPWHAPLLRARPARAQRRRRPHLPPQRRRRVRSSFRRRPPRHSNGRPPAHGRSHMRAHLPRPGPPTAENRCPSARTHDPAGHRARARRCSDWHDRVESPSLPRRARPPVPRPGRRSLPRLVGAGDPRPELALSASRRTSSRRATCRSARRRACRGPARRTSGRCPA